MKYQQTTYSLKQGGVRCKQYTSFQTYLQLPESIKSRIIFIRCVSEPLIDHHPVCFSPGIPGKNSSGISGQSVEKKHAPGSREELQHVLYVAQTYFGHLLSPTEIECIMFFYDDLHFSADLLEYLVEYCVSKGSTSIHYLKKVGLAWQESGIRDVASAKQETTTFNKHYYTILKAFGIRNRAPVEKEAEMMDRWLNTYGFTIDLITEACQRTVSKIGQPSFQYAEGILSKWKEQGVRSMADVEQRDAEHQKRKKTASDQNAARKTAPAASSNRFNNFHQREYDYQKLEEQLLK